MYQLKAKCKTAAKTSREKLSKDLRILAETIKHLHWSYKNLESPIYRSRREVESTIPRCAPICIDTHNRKQWQLKLAMHLLQKVTKKTTMLPWTIVLCLLTCKGNNHAVLSCRHAKNCEQCSPSINKQSMPNLSCNN